MDGTAHSETQSVRHCCVPGWAEGHACPYCEGVAFGTKRHLTVHLDTVHLELQEHKCPYCKGGAFGCGGGMLVMRVLYS